MKKYFFTTLLFFAFASSYAQSLSFEDLLNLTNMNSTQSHDFLMSSKGFKSLGIQMVNGKSLEEYNMTQATPAKIETVSLGASFKGTAGNVSREVFYFTSLEADINSLIAQAKKSTLSLVFQGSDLNKNIYRFDNSLFRATISISFDKKSGSIQVQQK